MISCALWEAKLREYLVDMGLSPRRTCEALECDFYTVNKYALKLGILGSEEVSFPKKHPRKPQKPSEQVLQAQPGNEVKQIYRKRWLGLISNHPDTIRSHLLTLDPECHLWLRKNDVGWYEQHSPPVSASMNWNARDIENLDKVQAAVKTLRETGGRPRWVNKGAVILVTGINQLGSKSAMARLPLTAAYLAENLESADGWRKRKIV